jgi:drug/metabolite transporter (DMT)-like permease
VFALLALASSVMWGTSDFFAGLRARTLAPTAVVAWSQGSALVLLSLVVVVAGPSLGVFDRPGRWAGFAVLAGLAGLMGLVSFYTALASGTMGVVAPIASLGAAVPVVLGVVAGERPSGLAYVGMVVAVAGAALASGPELTRGGPVRTLLRPLLLAMVAAVGFGLALYFLNRGARGSLLGTLWGMRLTSMAVFVTVALSRRSAGGVRPGDLPRLTAIGAGDVGANLLFGLASTRGMVSVASVLGSMYPAVTVIWARLLLKEMLRPVQLCGVALSLVGVVAMTL